jgi:hypothetical protein
MSFSIACFCVLLRSMIRFFRALWLRTLDLVVSFGAPPYSYDAAGDSSARLVHPTTYSLRKAINRAEKFVIVSRPPKKRGHPVKSFKTVFINGDPQTILYSRRRADFPDDIVDRLF